MSKGPFSLDYFARNANGPLLGKFLQEVGVPWDEAGSAEVAPQDVVAAIRGVPDKTRSKVELECEAIHDLACEEGIRLAVEEGNRREMDLVIGLTDHLGFYQQALWLWMEHPEVFALASLFLDLHSKNGRYWYSTHCPAALEPSRDAPTLKRLERTLEAYLGEKEGRGGSCTVEWYPRGERHIFLVYAEDYARADPEFEQKQLIQRLKVPAFQMVFVYDPLGGIIDIHCHGGRKKAKELQEVFCAVVFGRRLPEAVHPKPVYEIDRVIRPDFRFVVRPGSSISGVEVNGVELVERDGEQAGMAFKRGKHEHICDTVSRYLATTPNDVAESGRPAFSLTRLCQVYLRVLFYPQGPHGRPGCKSFWLGRDVCRLGHEGRGALIHEMLRDSGIERVADLLAA